MLVDAALTTTDLQAVPDAARGIEAAGYDGIYSFEGAHDGFFPLLLAAEHTERVQLTTAVAIAFARNPMTLAQLAYDLQLASRGRFNLGLGTQIKPHIEKRFSMQWSKPAERMRELVLAVRAIWARWHEGTKLDFRGDFYTHTLMTPFFDPGPNPFGVPRIFLGGVGPRMTEVAGEVADGFMIHPFSTERFMRETTLPALERGLDKSGRRRSELEVAFPAMVIVAESDEELARGRDAMRPRLAFYEFRLSCKLVLDAHGWGELQPELNRLSKTGDWSTMASMITDEIVDTFVVFGTPKRSAPACTNATAPWRPRLVRHFQPPLARRGPRARRIHGTMAVAATPFACSFSPGESAATRRKTRVRIGFGRFSTRAGVRPRFRYRTEPVVAPVRTYASVLARNRVVKDQVGVAASGHSPHDLSGIRGHVDDRPGCDRFDCAPATTTEASRPVPGHSNRWARSLLKTAASRSAVLDVVSSRRRPARRRRSPARSSRPIPLQ